jgi:predicted dehydrogenase
MAGFSNSGVDEISDYMFRFPSGTSAAIHTSYNLGMKRTAMIYGSKGYKEFDWIKRN